MCGREVHVDGAASTVTVGATTKFDQFRTTRQLAIMVQTWSDIFGGVRAKLR
jgi:hypothetical protein